jgi:hypothetical protein
LSKNADLQVRKLRANRAWCFANVKPRQYREPAKRAAVGITALS